jgi:prepilin-type N-terminal cleavage/methylation domain-containing protein
MLLHRRIVKKAFTLFELLLVLAIFVALVGIAIPTFDSMISSRRLIQSTTQLRNEIAEARVTAMKTGQAQVLRATLQSQDYSITPWLGSTDSEDASAGATVADASGQIVKTESVAGGGVATADADLSGETRQLQEGVLFSMIETIIDNRNAADLEESGELAAGGSNAGISSPILFYPDGSTTSAQVILVDPKGRRMAIQIRGMTGQLSILRLTSIQITQ